MKKTSFSTFIKNTGIFFLGNVLSKVIVFLLLPLYTHYISTESYGYYDLSISYITVLTSLVYFDIWATVLRFMYDAKDKKGKQNIASTCWVLFSISTVVFLVLGGVICAWKSVRYAPLILGYGLSVNLHNMCGFITRGWKKNIHFALSGILNTVTMVSVNLVLILGFHVEIESLYISAIAGNLIQMLYLCLVVHAYPHFRNFKLDKKLFSAILRYTLPLCINSVSYWLLTSYNRIVLEDIMGLSANGIYAVGNKFGAAISLVTTCFTYAWQDLAFSRQTQRADNSRFYAKACSAYFAFLAAGLALMLPCFNLLFPVLIGEAYREAFDTIPLFLIMAMLSAYSTFVGNIFYAIKDTKTIFLSMVLSCICNLIICRLLIQLWGINGANLAICLSFLLNILLRYGVLYKKIRFRPHWLLKFTACLLVGAAAVIYLYTGFLVNGLFFTVVLLCAAVIVYRKFRRNRT